MHAVTKVLRNYWDVAEGEWVFELHAQLIESEEEVGLPLLLLNVFFNEVEHFCSFGFLEVGEQVDVGLVFEGVSFEDVVFEVPAVEDMLLVDFREEVERDLLEGLEVDVVDFAAVEVAEVELGLVFEVLGSHLGDAAVVAKPGALAVDGEVVLEEALVLGEEEEGEGEDGGAVCGVGDAVLAEELDEEA